jgi:hypothetical protein
MFNAVLDDYPLKPSDFCNEVRDPKTSTFSPRSVLLCFLLGSPEQTVMISLSSIKWLVPVTVAECAYCAVCVLNLGGLG